MGGTRESRATPANRSALDRHYDHFLSKDLSRCTTCHLPSDRKNPESLKEFPHNPFGDRLRQLGEGADRAPEKRDLARRLARIASEDADGDGIDNETELLLGHNPGDAKDTPSSAELKSAKKRSTEFKLFLSSYHWQPFAPVHRPAIPKAPAKTGGSTPNLARNPIDLFLSAERTAHHLKPRPEAPREILLRRLYIDLIGLNPTLEEQQRFLKDASPQAYENCVDRLLADPRYGERWARHWMDVWRYSDWAGWTDGGQVRDSKPHIWRWRDWIVESINADKSYDRMLQEMLAADELAPQDTSALRATGFLVRNYKMLSREQWMEDTLKHTSQAFLGITVGCSKCHDHPFDPLTQREYYSLRAVFEPHQVRTDRVPGQTNTVLDGLARAYDASNAPTYLFVRGDERHPITNEIIAPGVPAALGGTLKIQEIHLPIDAIHPDQREFVMQDLLAAARRATQQAYTNNANALASGTNSMARLKELEFGERLASLQLDALKAVIDAERAQLKEGTSSPQGQEALLAAQAAVRAQRNLRRTEADAALYRTKASEIQNEAALALKERAFAEPGKDEKQAAKAQKEVTEARGSLEEARKKTASATETLAKAATEMTLAADTAFSPRAQETYPATSTGRRLALARWITQPENPLTARVAVNHIWLRHFGRALVPNPADFGRNGRVPSHPQLVDWLAAEFMSKGWSMKRLHRLMVTSAAYRMSSTPNETDAGIDPDNIYLWRANSRRLEAEAVRDNLLHVAGNLDTTVGGPDIDNKLALTSLRRSIYLRQAAEKQPEFLQIFDGPSVTECYERHPSVIPQQALALANSELVLKQARLLSKELVRLSGGDEAQFIELAFGGLFARRPTLAERVQCLEFLKPTATRTASEANKTSRAAENLILVLFNHNDFITVR